MFALLVALSLLLSLLLSLPQETLTQRKEMIELQMHQLEDETLKHHSTNEQLNDVEGKVTPAPAPPPHSRRAGAC